MLGSSATQPIEFTLQGVIEETPTTVKTTNALVVRIQEAYETVEEDEIVALDRAEDERTLATEASEANEPEGGAA